MKKQILLSLIVLLLVACSADKAAEETVVSPVTSPFTPTSIPAAPTMRPTAVPATAVPLRPAITVSLQTVADDGVLRIDEVLAAEAGWVAIYAQRDGKVGEMLAYTAVAEGVNRGITVAIPPMLATEKLIAMLYAGEDTGFFDAETAVVTHSFEIVLDIATPIIAVIDQSIGEDGMVEFENVYTAVDGWIVLYNDENGTIGRPLAHQFVEAGGHDDIRIPIPLHEATAQLHAALFIDDGVLRHYESDDVDTAVLVSGTPVVATFEAALPPSILAYDQPLLDNTLVIDRAVSDGDGWLVAYNDSSTTSGGVIVGFAPLADGVNEMVSVTISSSSLDTVYLLLHKDGGEMGVFGVSDDLPIMADDGRLPPPTVVHTDKASYLITRDQPIRQEGDVSSVTIPLVAAVRPVWVVINNDEGKRIGKLLLPAGLNRDVVVPVELDGVMDGLTAVLHRDDGKIGEFEYPEGDASLHYNFGLIESPFLIQDK